MKRVYQELPWKRHSKRRQLYELDRRKARQERQRGRRVPRLGPLIAGRITRELVVDGRRALEVSAPEVLCLRENPDGVCRFLHDLMATERARDGRSLHVQLRGVKRLGTAALAALTSRASQLQAIGGSVPEDRAVRTMFEQSGFLAHFRSRESSAPLPTATGDMRRKGSFKVEADTALELVHFATRQMYGDERFLPGVQRIFIESMSNTREHAPKRALYPEPWWATVYFDPETRTTTFTFVDNGVGIFRSVKIKTLARRMLDKLGLVDQRELLHELLRGELGSRTGLAYRGKGLPAIHRVFQHGQVQNLLIMSNSVYADLAQNDFRTLETEFRGTLLSWELRE